MPPGGLKTTPLRLLLTDQLRLPEELASSETVTVQLQVLELESRLQGLPLVSLKPVGDTYIFGGVAG